MTIEDPEVLGNIKKIKDIYGEQREYLHNLPEMTDVFIVSHAIQKLLNAKRNYQTQKLAYLRKKSKGLPMIYSNQKRLCYYCRKYISKYQDGNLDHKLPLSRGGDSDFDNLAFTCLSCNSEKDSMTEKEYLTYRKERHAIHNIASGVVQLSSSIEGVTQDMAV